MQIQIRVKRSQTAEVIEANLYCILPAVYKTEADVQLTKTIYFSGGKLWTHNIGKSAFIYHLETVDLIYLIFELIIIVFVSIFIYR